ncbi:MAG: TlpA disulfide reductase family protein [Candidatus Omnitrophota bacterium]
MTLEMSRKYLVPFMTTFLLLGMAGAWGPGECASSKAPPFSLSTPEGETVRLEDFSGKVVYLDFWSSQCYPCLLQIPQLVSLYNAHREKGLVVIGISLGDSEDTLRHYIQKMGITYPVVAGDDQIVELYRGIYFLPTAFLIDREGLLRKKFFGYRDREAIEHLILPLLEE